MAEKPFSERITGGVVGIAGESHGGARIDRTVIQIVQHQLAAAYPHAAFDTGINYAQGFDTIVLEYERGANPANDETAAAEHRDKIVQMIAQALAEAP
jgi:hypothetical protein